MITVRGLRKSFPLPRTLPQMVSRRPHQSLRALRGVDLAVAAGEIVGVVGESGCGKSTFGRCVAGLETPDEGTVLWEGASLPAARMARAARIQMVFQDPYASLNPRLTIGQMIAEALGVHAKAGSAAARRDRVDALLTMVGLDPALRDRLPHAISGGQRQRISIARALAVEPRLLIADEPVSALDASVQAQIINLLQDLRVQLGISILFIAHDLNVVRHISDRIVVMYLGEVVESGTADALFDRPLHPYTRALLAAIPLPDPARRDPVAAVEGEMPDPLDPPPGCAFSSRCSFVLPACIAARPELREVAGRQVRCINPAASTDFGAPQDVTR